MRAVIHHNPNCGTSRVTLRLLEASGAEVVIVPYLDTGWSRPQLEALFTAAGLTPGEALRTTKSPAEELGLLNDGVSDDALLDAMVAHPILVNRPIVVTRKGTALCRPADKVLDLLERWPNGPFYKENGEMILDADGRRV